MNAAEQANNVVVASKIASVVTLFKTQFPGGGSISNPGQMTQRRENWLILILLILASTSRGRSRLLQSRCILIEIRFYHDPIDQTRRVIGVEAAGYDHQGQQWKLSIIENWNFVGKTEPEPESAKKLKLFCRQIFQLFNPNP